MMKIYYNASLGGHEIHNAIKIDDVDKLIEEWTTSEDITDVQQNFADYMLSMIMDDLNLLVTEFNSTIMI
jgi:hypothetical protein